MCIRDSLTTLYAFSPCWRRNKKYNRFTRKRKARVISTFQCTLCHNLVSRVFRLAKWKSLGRRLTASPWQPELHSAIFLACAAERKCSVSFRANEMIFLKWYFEASTQNKGGLGLASGYLFRTVGRIDNLQLRLSRTKEFRTAHHFKEIYVSWQHFQVEVDREIAFARRVDLSMLVQKSTLPLFVISQQVDSYHVIGLWSWLFTVTMASFQRMLWQVFAVLTHKRLMHHFPLYWPTSLVCMQP